MRERERSYHQTTARRQLWQSCRRRLRWFACRALESTEAQSQLAIQPTNLQPAIGGGRTISTSYIETDRLQGRQVATRSRGILLHQHGGDLARLCHSEREAWIHEPRKVVDTSARIVTGPFALRYRRAPVREQAWGARAPRGFACIRRVWMERGRAASRAPVHQSSCRSREWTGSEIRA